MRFSRAKEGWPPHGRVGIKTVKRLTRLNDQG